MYINDQEAFKYLSERYDMKFSPSQLKKALYRAFDKIEEISVRNPGEVNNFPRIGEKEVPARVKKAQCEEAYAILLRGEKNKDLILNGNLKSKSDGDFSVTYFEGSLQGITFNSRIAHDIMKKYIRKTFSW